MLNRDLDAHDLQSAYAGRRVLITGHTGFKGGWLALWLHRLGAEVFGIALPPAQGGPSLFSALRLEELIDHRIADLRHEYDFRATASDIDADIIFHLAAQPLVRRSYEIPADTFLVNVVGTARVLDTARRMRSLRAGVMVTSDKCYDNIEDGIWGYRETDRMGGADPYSASKGCCELLVSSYRKSFFSADGAAGIATARAGNVIGGGDWSCDRLVPDMLRAAFSGTPVHIRNPSSIRPWQHVLEPLAGYLQLGARLLREGQSWADGWNFGPDIDALIDVAAVAAEVKRCWAGTLETETAPSLEALHEARTLRLDNSKAKALLGWNPGLTVADAVDLTVAWHHAHTAGADMRAFTLEQIDRYAASYISAPARCVTPVSKAA